jgi:hypothetical protein
MDPHSTTDGGSLCLSLVLHHEWAKPRRPLNGFATWATTSLSVVGRCCHTPKFQILECD